VSDGLLKADMQWKDGRKHAAAPAEITTDLSPYVHTFLKGIDPWLQATNTRRMRAEVFDLPKLAPLRVVRFVLENKTGPSFVTVVQPQGQLAALLARMGELLGVRLSSSLVGERELRVHGPDEVVIIKPASRRFWLRSAGLEDADAVIAESIAGAVE
jgi:hypothetical protein